MGTGTHSHTHAHTHTFVDVTLCRGPGPPLCLPVEEGVGRDGGMELQAAVPLQRPWLVTRETTARSQGRHSTGPHTASGYALPCMGNNDTHITTGVP